MRSALVWSAAVATQLVMVGPEGDTDKDTGTRSAPDADFGVRSSTRAESLVDLEHAAATTEAVMAVNQAAVDLLRAELAAAKQETQAALAARDYALLKHDAAAHHHRQVLDALVELEYTRSRSSWNIPSSLIHSGLLQEYQYEGERSQGKPAKAKDKDRRLIDTRTPDEFSAGAVSGAINIPHTTEMDDITAKLTAAGITNKDEALGVYCVRGRRAELLKELLESLGHTDVLNVHKVNGQPIDMNHLEETWGNGDGIQVAATVTPVSSALVFGATGASSCG